LPEACPWAVATKQGDKKQSKQYDSVLTEMETYSDSDSPLESGQVFPEILTSIEGLLPYCSTSSMVVQVMVYGVPQENQPISFENSVSGPQTKARIAVIQC